MAVGMKTSIGDTTTQVRSVVADFDLLSPTDVPFLKLISGGSESDPSLNSLDAECKMTKFEWIEDADMPYVGSLSVALADGVATSVNLNAELLAHVNEGVILQFVSGEQALVTAAAGTNPITVTRAWGGTTGAAQALNSEVLVIGRATREGADAPSAVFTFPTMPYNLTQTFADTILLSHIEQQIERYGIARALDYETAKKSRQLFRLMERQCFYGKRVVGTSSIPSTFGGLETFIPTATKTDGASGALTETLIGNGLQKIYNEVGQSMMPDTIVCGPWLRRKISSIYAKGTSFVTRTADQAERRGGVRVDTVLTDFGQMDVMMTDLCRPNYLYFIRKEKLGIGPLRNLAFKREPLAKTGTADKWMISGVYTFQVRAAKCHGFIYDLSTST